ncbi:hypothetical protein [Mangrovibrevibacter kandeliae]|uniref:hypothetical protein n=1 Tax=Mangrovibrevibacter kandeliae TaxID=2968473 RepID=UPI0021177F99|nr:MULTISPECIES: hypothetical protein [unclassified Aurantimonas]MCQ8780610.1 hypothetical protein [Aurantimonas sp. CSK15Z-1]MCW4113391.1 hypothetical protein [Aurantimonas sp. MSK8Z-1]
MTELLRQAIDRLRVLPAERQDEYARVLLRLAGADDQAYELTADELADLAEADTEVARGEFASDREVAAVFSKFAT